MENAVTLEMALEGRLGFQGKVHIGVDGRIPLSHEDEKVEIELGEAYLDLYLDTTDWRIGRQVVSWGTADGINPTNVINPRTPFSPAELLSEGALRGKPVLALLGAYYLPNGSSLTGVGIAEFVPAAGGEEMLETLASRIGAQVRGTPLPVAGPEPVPTDGSQFEWAVRGEGLVSGHNVYVTYFRGWDDYPAAWIEYLPIPEDTFIPAGVAAKYRQVQKFGLATAGTIGDAGVWTELSYTVFDKLAALDGPGALSSNDPYLEAVIGADYSFKNGVTLSGQVIYHGGGSLLTPYKEPGADIEAKTYVLGIARYSPEPGHNLEGIVLANPRDAGMLAAGRYTYDITQAVKLTVGLSHVIADSGSEFHELKSRANLITAAMQFSF